MQKRIISAIAALTLAAAGAMTVAPADAGPADRAAAKKKATQFAFQGSGFGTRVAGGQVPAGSDTTAWHVIGCSNKAGLTRRNFVAEEQLVPGAARAEEITTRLTTRQRGGVTSTTSTSDVARVVLNESGLGRLRINAISSVSKAFHDKGGFGALTETTVGRISFVPTGQDPQNFPVPTPGQPVEIPGVARIAIGDMSKGKNADMARAQADGLTIRLLPSNTQVRIAHTDARIEKGVTTGLMSGSSMGARSSLLGGVAQVGRTPLSVMPCAGTDGEERIKSIAHVPLAEGIDLRNLTSRQLGVQTKRKARGFEFGRVGVAEFDQADLLIRNVTGQVNVSRVIGKGLKRNINGTKVGKITFQGQEQSFDPGQKTIEIPGVAVITKNIVERSRHGIHVIALQVKLLDGTDVESVVNLGEANLRIKKAAR